MMTAATRAQVDAANPANSVWLGANAGSGKTRVLTDRVARLLLDGVDPQNILCLTYTKAAAAEMQNRLFKRLGVWAMLPDAALRDALQELDATPPKELSQARTLFARAVETPGGLKIQTIHSFCASILRRFPREAGVSPQFVEIEERQQADLIADVLDTLGETHPERLIAISEELGHDLTSIATLIVGKVDAFDPRLSQEAVCAAFGVRPDLSADDLVREALSEGDMAFLKTCSDCLSAEPKVSDQKLGSALAGLGAAPTTATLLALEGVLLLKSDPFTPKTSQPTKGARAGAFAALASRFDSLAEAVHAARNKRLAIDAARKTSALHGFASLLIPAYEAAKERHGFLDFDDLIRKTRSLLRDETLAWVLYRLDGDLQHILIDEAQDTSPVQWSVIDSLVTEILAGEGAQASRSLFVVGDKKQSIYSFQGADARMFDEMSRRFQERMRHGTGLAIRQLSYSFRSSRAILAAVDSVFKEQATRGLGPDVEHLAFKEGLPGRVDLWPLEPSPEKPADVPWYSPVDRIIPNAAPVLLAGKIADFVSEQLKYGTIADETGAVRRIQPEDIMVLVQGRNELFHQIIRAFKSAGLPVPGADKLKVAGELAVRDLLALISFLALPEDDLSLAAALRSPLFGWSEQDLFTLAYGRQGFLWEELRGRSAEWPETMEYLDALRRRIDFRRPFELLEEILTGQGGREKLVARLGHEAEDGIDALLEQALAFERTGVPTLQGFLAFAKSDANEIKRQADPSTIRVMTVHGAKGLEAPIVILPDTVRKKQGNVPPVVLDDQGRALWRMRSELSPDTVTEAKDAEKLRDWEERQRLLYVAMTRAESWLIVAGIEPQKTEDTWHEGVSRGLEAAGAYPIETPTGNGLRLSHGQWPDPLTEPAEDLVAEAAAPLDSVLAGPAPSASPTQDFLTPSDLGGAKALPGGSLDEAAAQRRGRQVHLLLEKADAPLDPDRCLSVLSFGPDPASAEEIPDLCETANRTIAAHPAIFSDHALAEVEIAATLGSLRQPLFGIVDRLVVSESRVLAVDFKTNEVVPSSPEDVPEGILRQMGAYLEALEQVWTDREIEVAILWTQTAEIMVLPHAIVRDALSRTPTS